MNNNPLFQIASERGVVSVSDILSKVEKAQKLSNTHPSVQTGSNGIFQTIANISEDVEKTLGQRKKDFLCLITEKEIQDYFNKLTTREVVAVNVKSVGDNPMTDEIIGISFFAKGIIPAYIPINHISYVTQQKLVDQPNKEFLGQQINRLNTKNNKLVMFDGKFCIRSIYRALGVRLNCWFDCLIAASLLNENETSMDFKPLHKKYVLQGKDDEFANKLLDEITFNVVPIEIGYLSAAHEAQAVYDLFNFQFPFLSVENERCIKKELQGVAYSFWNIEMPCLKVFADLEDRGMLVNLTTCNKLKDKYIPLLAKKKQEFAQKLKEFGIEEEIEVSSPKQVAHLFYDILRLESPDFRNPRGTGKDILELLDHPLVDAVKEYKAFATLVNSFVTKLPEVINKEDGRIHCCYKQLGAKTGRVSCTNPNLQQVPANVTDIRQMFIASPGYVLIGSDFGQQEPKIMSYLSGDAELTRRAKEGRDIYATIASIAFKKPYEECLEFQLDANGNKTDIVNKDGKKRRSAAKTLVLGISYGMGIPSIAKKLNCSKSEAQEIFNSVLSYCSGLNNFIEESKQMARAKGYVTTLWGMRRRLPQIQLPQYSISYTPERIEMTKQSEVAQQDVNFYVDKLSQIKNKWEFYNLRKLAKAEGVILTDNSTYIASAERQCVNARIQGTASQMTKIAMIKIANDETLKKLGFKLLLQVHDELIGECPFENRKQAAERFGYLMANCVRDEIPIPFSTDVVCSREWYGESVPLC